MLIVWTSRTYQNDREAVQKVLEVGLQLAQVNEWVAQHALIALGDDNRRLRYENDLGKLDCLSESEYSRS